MADEADDVAVYTLGELIEEEDELHEESVAVLGASDAMNCSYSKGYIKRQALYACLTCNPSSDPDFQPAGVCLACSYKCHDKHDLVELYTKRNFRCDCGNKKFSGSPCLLQPEKDELNLQNAYNQNFKGVYCTCHRPYPDPENKSDDPMYQCVICEDWYHEKHSEGNWSETEDSDATVEMICGSCTPKYPFLSHYSDYIVKNKNGSSCTLDPADKEHEESVSGAEKEISSQNLVVKDATVKENGAEAPTAVCGSSACVLSNSTKTPLSEGKLWVAGWRKHLCRCPECMEMYSSLKVSFLLDEEDTFENYEAQGKANEQCAKEKSERDFDTMFQSLGRVGQMEAIHGINEMKESMNEFFKKFAENGKVIRKEDVQELFDSMKAKRRKLNENHVPNTCR